MNLWARLDGGRMGARRLSGLRVQKSHGSYPREKQEALAAPVSTSKVESGERSARQDEEH